MNSQPKLTTKQTILIVGVAILVGILGIIVFLAIQPRNQPPKDLQNIVQDTQKMTKDYILPSSPRYHPASNDTKDWNNDQLMMSKGYPSSLKHTYDYRSSSHNDHAFKVTKWKWDSHVSHHNYIHNTRGYWVIAHQHQIDPSIVQSKKMPLWDDEPSITEGSDGQLVFNSVRGNEMLIPKNYYKNIGY